MGGAGRKAKSISKVGARVGAGTFTLGGSELARSGLNSLKPDIPDAQAPPGGVDEEAVAGETPEEAALRKRRQLAAQALLSGRSSTVKTSPLGLTEAASNQPRTLLGG